ncbi:MAG: UDP-N-acetylmuramoyl-L-alanine--D-glutamate ligase, partial [Rhodothermales bacterium]|nr:UDP-N-acetylmuramoyl-L-alanine--D-glutamate ligase [Rhodothermales bacterium]
EPSASGLHQAGIEFESDGHSDRALKADLLVISPGVPTASSIVSGAIQRQVPVYSELEAASWFCRAPILAVTGSNGKTTTTALLGHILRTAGKRVHVAGNIGLAFSAIVDEAADDDFVVLEVSSFQLDHIATFRPKVSLLLNITPDHLDRYGDDLKVYAASKYRIAENQADGDAVVYNADDPMVVDGIPKNRKNPPETIPFSLQGTLDHGAYVAKETIIINLHGAEERLMQVNEVALRGRHNLYNSLAAAVAARVADIRSEIVRESLAAFEGVPHRLELIRTISGVKFVNDSKSTNVNSLWYALESFTVPVVLIAGGRDKGNDYSSLTDLVRTRTRAIVAIGESADKVLQELGAHAPEAVHAETMEEAVELARALARRGDAVLLSPACASFDMFEDYVDRGETFRRIVNAL